MWASPRPRDVRTESGRGPRRAPRTRGTERGSLPPTSAPPEPRVRSRNMDSPALLCERWAILSEQGRILRPSPSQVLPLGRWPVGSEGPPPPRRAGELLVRYGGRLVSITPGTCLARLGTLGPSAGGRGGRPGRRRLPDAIGHGPLPSPRRSPGTRTWAPPAPDGPCATGLGIATWPIKERPDCLAQGHPGREGPEARIA